MKRTLLLLAAVAQLVLSCQGEKTGVVAGPPLAIANASPGASPPSPLPSTSDGEPVVAAFADVGATPRSVSLGLCEEIIVAGVSGAVRAEEEELAPGDVILMQGEGTVVLTGSGVAVLAAVRERPCDARPERQKRVVRANVAPELAWAGGAMRAHLDVEKEASPFVYVGRLEGSAPVAEHAHPGAWEVICAIEASGTFTLNGEPRRLAPRSCVRVPPGAMHSWKPDEQTRLVAVQLYDPPGPEQRFKKLAADARTAPADAGAYK